MNSIKTGKLYEKKKKVVILDTSDLIPSKK